MTNYVQMVLRNLRPEIEIHSARNIDPIDPLHCRFPNDAGESMMKTK